MEKIKEKRNDHLFILAEIIFLIFCYLRIYLPSEKKIETRIIIVSIIFSLIISSFILLKTKPLRKKDAYLLLTLKAAFLYPALFSGKRLFLWIISGAFLALILVLSCINTEKKIKKLRGAGLAFLFIAAAIFMLLVFKMYAPPIIQEETLLEY